MNATINGDTAMMAVLCEHNASLEARDEVILMFLSLFEMGFHY